MPYKPVASARVESGNDLVEQGVGLIARGMFRMGDKAHGNDPKAAYDSGMAAVSIIREMAFNFLHKAKRKD